MENEVTKDRISEHNGAAKEGMRVGPGSCYRAPKLIMYGNLATLTGNMMMLNSDGATGTNTMST